MAGTLMAEQSNRATLEQYTIDLDMAPTPEEARLIAEGLYESVEALFETRRERRPFSVFARSPDGTVVGGVNARLAFGDLHVDQLWCSERIRRRGYGSRLLVCAEDYGRANGAAASLLNTFDPDLVGFYERRGYHMMGEIAGLAARRPVFFMRKPL
jgi:GNAT superfamily N-acetyltransferase